MTMTDSETAIGGEARFDPESPFAEALPEAEATGERAGLGLVPWTESFSPFAEVGELGETVSSETEAAIAEAFESLRDEQFDEALAELVSETAEAADQRLVGESPTGLSVERERLADAHLAPVTFEAEQYVQRLHDGLAGVDVASLSEQQLDELFQQFEPASGGLTPAGEEFIGGLVRKAKSVVKTVVRTAGKLAKGAIGLLGPVLGKLKALIRPLLKRVLAIAVNRLPTALRGPARMIARRFGVGEAEAEAEDEAEDEGPTTPVAVGNPEALAESFDAALAESMGADQSLVEQGETFGYEDEDEGPVAEAHLESLAEARSTLVDELRAVRDEENLTPAIEQFIPALLPALRLGITLVGRPKVVSFLAGFLANLLRKWVGPQLAAPLSSAIVDVGLRLVTLEAEETEQLEHEGGPAVLAATIEDTVRRLSEQEGYVFEDEDLLQLAVTDAFEHAVATNFPSRFVRPGLQTAPALGGSFVPRHFRRAYAYKKYSRLPEIELTAPVASSIRTHGGVPLAAVLAARGMRLPARVRIHVYESTVGTSLPRLARLEPVRGLRSAAAGWRDLHPLTRDSAALLLQAPALGTTVPQTFLTSPHRIAAGQRFYYLEPVGPSTAALLPALSTGGGVGASRVRCAAPSQGRVTVNLRRSEVLVALYLSESDAQAAAAAMSQGRSHLPLLRALAAAYDVVGASDKAGRAVRFGGEGPLGEDEAEAVRRRLTPLVAGTLRRSLRRWTRAALAEWSRTSAHEFARAAQGSACGVTVRLTLRGVPGLASVRQVVAGQPVASAPVTWFRGTPSGTVAVEAGRRLR